MAQLLVRNLDDNLVKLLKIRAAEHGLSMEAEHRRILKKILVPHEETKAPSFKKLLLNMPEIDECDLSRTPDFGRDIEW